MVAIDRLKDHFLFGLGKHVPYCPEYNELTDIDKNLVHKAVMSIIK
jgi:hypothetical protein